MQVRLRVFEQEHLVALERWDKLIDGDQFMSRRSPAPTAAGPGHLASPLWYLIELNGAAVGTVWLEGGQTVDVAVLGILLGDLFGRGIGRRAIDLAVQHLNDATSVSRVTLNVRVSNARAIACYARCGFTITETSVKELADGRQIQYHTMTRQLA